MVEEVSNTRIQVASLQADLPKILAEAAAYRESIPSILTEIENMRGAIPPILEQMESIPSQIPAILAEVEAIQISIPDYIEDASALAGEIKTAGKEAGKCAAEEATQGFFTGILKTPVNIVSGVSSNVFGGVRVTDEVREAFKDGLARLLANPENGKTVEWNARPVAISAACLKSHA